MKVNLDLSKHEAIPKNIFISWKNKDILDNQSPLILNGIANLKNINPDYKLEISDDHDVEEYLKNKLSNWDYFKIRNKKIVEKIDLWRLLKIYHEGGIYVDIDRYCNISFKNLIKKDTKCILPTHGDIDFSQDIMMSCKSNPIFKKAIEYNLKRRFIINPRGVFHLGPIVFMWAVTEIVFGQRESRKPSNGIMSQYRKLLGHSKYFQTYKESPPYDTILFRYKENEFQKGNGFDKEQFYQSQNVKHWSSGFDNNTIILVFILSIIFLICYIIFENNN